ncbi:uncharacterized protein LOC113874369 [Abrus precatorius]|uniref:Uncharacterized protein LOC113874369 n=1 Tax=Abrus precatorius TaxID=3816 RepID=A0A8B8MLB0_ABRPR|nr:uncharacterized protein LOC113874369 [Abrus precatorius]
MSVVAMGYFTNNNYDEETIIYILVAGFIGQLKVWWDNYLTETDREHIVSAVKIDDRGKTIVNNNEQLPDAVYTLLYCIAQHFLEDPSLWKGRSGELLSNLRCTYLGHYKLYKDTFMSRIYTREDCNQPFWKEKFLDGLPKSFGDLIRSKFRSYSINGEIPYESFSYGQLNAIIVKNSMKVCLEDKIHKQLAKEKSLNKKELGSFCEQFGLPSCSIKKKKQTHKKETDESHKKPYKRKYNRKPLKKHREDVIPSNIPRKLRTGVTCYNYGKLSHISKYCRLKKKINNLNLDPSMEDQINNLLIESSDEDFAKDTNEDINQIQ